MRARPIKGLLVGRYAQKYETRSRNEIPNCDEQCSRLLARLQAEPTTAQRVARTLPPQRRRVITDQSPPTNAPHGRPITVARTHPSVCPSVFVIAPRDVAPFYLRMSRIRESMSLFLGTVLYFCETNTLLSFSLSFHFSTCLK